LKITSLSIKLAFQNFSMMEVRLIEVNFCSMVIIRGIYSFSILNEDTNWKSLKRRKNTLSFFTALGLCVGKKMKVCFVHWQKKIKNEALAGRFSGQSVGICVQICSFHISQFDVSTVVLGFPVTVWRLAKVAIFTTNVDAEN